MLEGVELLRLRKFLELEAVEVRRDGRHDVCHATTIGGSGSGGGGGSEGIVIEEGDAGQAVRGGDRRLIRNPLRAHGCVFMRVFS